MVQKSLLPPIPPPQPETTVLLRIDKTIRIAVSGDVHVTRLERDIIDTRDFQRLRGVRQLGSLCHVYPTALHTRFDHSLGTLAMADKMVKHIRQNTHSGEQERRIDQEQEILIRLYALLHDIGHVPFGHTIEDELGLITRHDENDARIQRFLGPDAPIGKLIADNLGKTIHDRLVGIHKWDGQDPSIGDDAFVYDIVSNTVCADLLDYLKRDDHFCNLGIALEYRFLSFLYLGQAPPGRRLFVRLWKGSKAIPRRDTLTDLSRLLEARYLLAERAYFHHAKIISGAMLGRAMQEAMDAGVLTEEDLYDHTDDTLVSHLAQAQELPIGSRLAQAVRERRLHKQLHRYSAEDFQGLQIHDHSLDVRQVAYSKVRDPQDRKYLEDQLAEKIGANPGDVIIYAPNPKMNLKPAEMRVLWKGKPFELRYIDDPIITPRLKQILDAHEALWGIHVLITPNLSERQRSLLKEACDIEFICPREELDDRRQDLYEKLIDETLSGADITKDRKIPEYVKRKREAAAELANAAADRRPWRVQVEAVVRKLFANEEVRDDASRRS